MLLRHTAGNDKQQFLAFSFKRLVGMSTIDTGSCVIYGHAYYK